MSEPDKRLAIIVRNTVPPGRWRYRCPIKEVDFEPQLDLEHLLVQIRKFRHGNHLPFDKGQVEHEICEQLGIQSSHCGEPPKPRPGQRVTRIGQAERKRFLTTIAEWGMKTKFACVPPDVAEKRAAICQECPEKGVVEDCKGCASVGNLLKRLLAQLVPVGQRQIGENLPSCLACGCSLPLKIHLPDGVGRAASPPNAQYPDNCWFTKDNY